MQRLHFMKEIAAPNQIICFLFNTLRRSFPKKTIRTDWILFLIIKK